MEKLINNNNNDFIEQIWNDADFKPKIKLNKIKNDKIRKLNNVGKTISYCKVCNCEISISCYYTGNFPLCITHRDPNYRNI